MTPRSLSTAQTSTRDSLLLTVRPEVSHTHNQDTTATVTTHSQRRASPKLHGSASSMERISRPLDKIPLLFPWSTAQTSMRDTLSRMERPEESHTHRLATTVTQTTLSSKINRHSHNKHGSRDQMVRTSRLSDQTLELFPWNTAQTSMRDSPSTTDKPEPSHTHNQVTTATQHTP